MQKQSRQSPQIAGPSVLRANFARIRSFGLFYPVIGCAAHPTYPATGKHPLFPAFSKTEGGFRPLERRPSHELSGVRGLPDPGAPGRLCRLRLSFGSAVFVHLPETASGSGSRRDSLHCWNDALFYLTGIAPQASPEAARSRLTAALAGLAGLTVQPAGS